MDLSLNEEQKMIAESAAVFLQEKSSTAQVRKVSETEGGLDRALWQEVVEMGWCSVALPEAAGGMGLGWRELVLLQEKMGYHLACVPFFDAVVAVTPLWQALSQTAQGLPVVERLAASGQICVLGMTVRGKLPTAATVKVEGDELVLSGEWSQVGSGTHADVFLLPATLPCGSLGLLEVSAKAQGLSVQALATVDVAFDETLSRNGDWLPLSGYEAALDLLSLPEPPTAILCGNDLMAIGALEAASERGLRVPDDVSIMGYDDQELARHWGA